MLLLRPSMVDSRIAIHPKPVLYIVALSCQELQDLSDTLFLCKHFMVHLHLFDELISIDINDRGSGFPKLVLVRLFVLQILLVSSDKRLYIIIVTGSKSVIRSLRELILE